MRNPIDKYSNFKQTLQKKNFTIKVRERKEKLRKKLILDVFK